MIKKTTKEFHLHYKLNPKATIHGIDSNNSSAWMHHNAIKKPQMVPQKSQDTNRNQHIIQLLFLHGCN